MVIELLENNYNTKSFTRNFINTLTLEGVLKEGSNVLNPEIVVEVDNPSNFNMMHIPAFNRYYFIEVENLTDNLWKIKAIESDVLFNNKTKLLNLDAIIDKQENKFNKYIDDGSYVTQLNTFIETKNFSNGFNDEGKFILITAGGT